MSQQYPGGFITKANVDPTSSFPLSPAPGVWTLDQQLQYKQAGVWPSYAVNAIEDVFSTYLYTGNGSVQSINNGIAIGSAYGGSVYFDGTGDNLSVANNAAFDFGSGDFTIELWLNPIAALAINKGIVVKRASGVFAPFMLVSDGTTPGIVRFLASTSGSNWEIIATSSTAVTLSAWNHIAIVRNGTTFTLYLNGTSVGSTTASGALMTNTSPVYIGYDPGYVTTGYIPESYISNLRIVKGTAVYTSNFTPPTAPLTAITNTSLLTCQSPSPTTDYSTNAFAVTVTNAVAQNNGGPFSDTTANKGGLVWIKSRSAIQDHRLFDTLRGATFHLATNSTDGQADTATSLTSFNSNGFSLGLSSPVNQNTTTFVSWTFREQAKFFDVVTYTGNGANRTISHNLGSVPGTIIIKRTNAVGAWAVYHRSLANTEYLVLNTTAAKATGATYWNSTTPTSTEFSLGTATDVNANGSNYVAYLFAHDAGGFGPNNTDNVISCGSFTTDGSANATVSLGYEPQFVLFKRTDSATNGDWVMFDNMRGMPGTGTGSTAARLIANTTAAENALTGDIKITATGFNVNFVANASFIYIAIRRGPMRPPTTGTSVFAVNFGSDVTTYTTNFPLDMGWDNQTTGNAANTVVGARLLGQGSASTASTAAEVTTYIPSTFWQSNSTYRFNAFGADCATFAFRRAPGFFDVVCWTGTGSYPFTINHNLGVIPELMIFKARNVSQSWFVYAKPLVSPNADWYQNYLVLQVQNARASDTTSFTTSPTSTTIPVASYYSGSGTNYVLYLFATVAGVSKVGSYTGTAALQTINCGFTGGARFVLIKRTDTTGDWWTYDSARGITSGNDPYFFLNSTAAQNTSTNYVDTTSVGFQVTAAAPAGLNASGGTYIFLAIA